MDQVTIQTIIEGGILITLIFLGDKLIGVLRSVANSLNNIDTSTREIANNTSTGGSDPKKTPPPNQ